MEDKENVVVLNKKENKMKKFFGKKPVKLVIQIGTTFLTLLNTGFIIWSCATATTTEAVPVAVPGEDSKPVDVFTDPAVEVAEF